MTVNGRRVLTGIVSLLVILAVEATHGITVSAQAPVPPNVAQQLTPVCPARRTGGAGQLTPQQSTRVEIVCRVSNPLTEAVDYSATMVFTLGERSSVAGGSADRGQITVVGNEIRWSGFSLNPGEAATATAMVDVTPLAADSGRTVNVFSSTRTTARTASGGFVEVTVGALPSSEVAGILSGGFVLQAGAAPSGAPPPGVAAPGAAPRTGTGAGTNAPRGPLRVGGSTATVLLLVLVSSTIAVRSRRRAEQQDQSP